MVRFRKKPRAGHFRTLVGIYKQDPDAEANSDGEVPESALLITERWVKVKPTRGTIKQFDGTQEDNITHLVRMRADEVTLAIDSRHWFIVLSTSQRLNIQAVYDADTRRKLLIAQCEERITA